MNINHKIFTKEEDEKITDAVRKFNSSLATELEKEELKKFIIDRTKLLLYYLPIKNFYLDEEMCAEFYIMMLPKIDNIITSFKISGESYIAYLAQLCKFRALSFSATKKKEIQTEMDLWVHELSMPLEYSHNTTLAASSKEKMDKYRSYDIEQIIFVIVDHTPIVKKMENAAKTHLTRYLTKSNNRRYFLMYCLFNLRNLSASLQEKLADYYDVDVELFSCLSEKLHEYHLQKYHKREEELKVINKHWRRMIVLRNALAREEDPFKRSELNYLYNLSVKSKNTRVKEMNSHLPGLSYDDLSEIFSVPNGTVASAIFRVRKKMEDLAVFAKEEKEPKDDD